MTLNDYQLQALTTRVYDPKYDLTYSILGLAGEAGELANIYKKVLRNYDGYLSDYMKGKLIDELGDVLWYVAAVAKDLGTNLDLIAENNLVKLAQRAKNNQLLVHEGDNLV